MGSAFSAETIKNTDLPILVGVAGHIDIASSAEDTIRQQVAHTLDMLLKKYKTHLRIVCGMALGADRLVVQLALERSIPVIALLPMARDKFRLTLKDQSAQDNFDKFLSQPGIEEIIELPQVTLPPRTDSKGITAAPDDTKAREDAEDILQYEQMGIVLCRLCHIIIALWNGKDTDPTSKRVNHTRKTRGGTAHIVSMRLYGEYADTPVSTFTGSELFSERLPRLELARSGPVLHIVTPRESAPSCDLPLEHAIWYAAEATSYGVPDPREFDLRTAQGAEKLRAVLPKDLDKIVEVSDTLRKTWAQDMGRCEQSISYLSVPASKGVPDSLLNQIKLLYAGADVFSLRCQGKLLGGWAPGLPLSKLWSWPYPLGALFVFAITLPIASACFEIYCEYGKNLFWLLGYITTLGLSGAFYARVVKNSNWQDNYQDYRALAEALRVQIYWATSGVSLGVSDNYLRYQEKTLGWIRQALRGPALYGVGAALLVQRRRQDTGIQMVDAACVTKEPLYQWITSQSAYFEKTEKTYQRALQWVNIMAVGALAGSVCVAVSLLVVQILYGGQLPETDPEWLREAPTVLIGFLPALAAYFFFFKEARAYDDTRDSCEQGLALFNTALQQAEHLKDNLPATAEDQKIWWQDWNDLATALGKEALAENGTWIQAHRAHPIKFQLGG